MDPEYTSVRENLKSKLIKLKAEIGDTDEQYPELMQVRGGALEGNKGKRGQNTIR